MFRNTHTENTYMEHAYTQKSSHRNSDIHTFTPDHLTCLLRHLYAGQEATVRTGHGTTENLSHSKLGKEYVKAVYCHPAYLTSMQSTS